MIDVQRWLAAGGIAILAAVVFAESGLLVGFFLPGDTLLFVAGFLCSNAGGRVLPSLPITAAVAFVAAAAGDQVGYVIGKRVGPALFHRPRSRLFNPTNVTRAESFFDRRGPVAVVVARFIPVVRTFTPIVAGVGRMRYRTFVAYNLVGAALWAVGITTTGYFLGEIRVIKDNLDYAAIVILIASLTPFALEYRRHRRRAARAEG
jgi:membrane-associated protein